jgi:hypothetical protein
VCFSFFIFIAGRSLLQDGFNCDGAKRLAEVGGACNLLCSCAASLDPNLRSNEAKKTSETNRCKDMCGKCQAAAKDCKKGSSLPGPCSEGQSNQYVKQCINTWLKAQG